MVQLLEEFKFSFGFVHHIYFFDANNLKYTGLKKLPHRVYSITTRIKTALADSILIDGNTSQSIFHYNKD